MIKKLEVNNFTVFDNIIMEFGGGIDVFIGENGTGKTHLLKSFMPAVIRKQTTVKLLHLTLAVVAGLL